jgi:hypothetical protein
MKKCTVLQVGQGSLHLNGESMNGWIRQMAPPGVNLAVSGSGIRMRFA